MLWVIIVVVVIAIAIAAGKEQAKAKAKKDYQESLQRLKRDPNDPDLREKTLELGRYYSNLIRDSKGHSLFDEVALMNDINAARHYFLERLPTRRLRPSNCFRIWTL